MAACAIFWHIPGTVLKCNKNVTFSLKLNVNKTQAVERQKVTSLPGGQPGRNAGRRGVILKFFFVEFSAL